MLESLVWPVVTGLCVSRFVCREWGLIELIPSNLYADCLVCVCVCVCLCVLSYRQVCLSYFHSPTHCTNTSSKSCFLSCVNHTCSNRTLSTVIQYTVCIHSHWYMCIYPVLIARRPELIGTASGWHGHRLYTNITTQYNTTIDTCTQTHTHIHTHSHGHRCRLVTAAHTHRASIYWMGYLQLIIEVWLPWLPTTILQLPAMCSSDSKVQRLTVATISLPNLFLTAAVSRLCYVRVEYNTDWWNCIPSLLNKWMIGQPLKLNI